MKKKRSLITIVYLVLFMLSYGIGCNAQTFSLPCKKYPASVPFKCDMAVDHYWHVTSVKCLGPANGGYKFRISGRATNSHRRESIDLLYMRGGNSVSVAGSYFFPAIEAGKIFSFDIVSAFRGRSPSRFNGFLIISRTLQQAYQQEIEAAQEDEEEETSETVETEEPVRATVASTPTYPPSNDDTVYGSGYTNLSFPGGPDELFKYLQNNLKYPVVAEEAGIQGRVIVTFIVEKDGSLSDIKVAKSVDPSLDNAAIRLVSNMPKWIPAVKDGYTVRARCSIPINYHL